MMGIRYKLTIYQYGSDSNQWGWELNDGDGDDGDGRDIELGMGETATSPEDAAQKGLEFLKAYMRARGID